MNSGTPRGAPPDSGAKKSPDAAVARDHIHVGRVSTLSTIAILSVIVVLAYALRTVLLPFVISGLIAYVCTPAVDWAAGRMRLPRALFASLAFLIILAMGAAFLLAALPQMVGETVHALTDFRGTVRQLVQGVIGSAGNGLPGIAANADQITDAVATAARNWIENAGRVAELGGMAFASIFGIMITLVLLFYFLLGGPSILHGLLRLVPPQERPLFLHVWRRLDPVLRRYFVGVICVVAYAAAAAYLGLGLILGIPHAALLAILTGVLEIIPVVGPAASAIIAGLVAIHHASGLGSIMAYAIYATALRLSIDQVFGPLALGTAARLNPAMIIFCFLAGGALFGIAGVLLSVPVALAVKTTLSILYDEDPAQPRAPSSH